MTKKQETPIGFKNEIVRIKPKVPDVIRNYPEKQFWKFSDAPFLSKSFFKLYVGFVSVFVISGGLVIWARDRFNLFQSRIYTGNISYETDLLWDFPYLDDKKVFKRPEFSDKFKQRERERLEEIKQAKLIREQELKSKQDKKVDKNVDVKADTKTVTTNQTTSK